MSQSQPNQQNKRPNNPRPKRPPLTHFLCVPLVNDVSLPQIESSIASFKAVLSSASSTASRQEHDPTQQQPRPVVPHDAIRPVGTLHLTLGVMSLPTPERLEEALQFFQSLDLRALFREANEIAKQKQLHAKTRNDSPLRNESTNEDAQETGLAATEADSVEPLSISLEGMHALQSLSSARILHAAPVDLTSRLYPFCRALRDKFVEGGFIQKENRPLLLHVTIVNMIYSRGGARSRSNYGKGKKGHGARPQTFDARDIVAHYRNYYQDSDRTIPKSSGGSITRSQSESHEACSNEKDDGPTVSAQAEKAGADGGGRENDQVHSTSNTRPDYGYPFIWARDIPIDTVTICEMGAKKLDPTGDESGMNARLGQKYAVVAERSLHSKTTGEP
ncbi:AKAP7 2'5' RNA ligase-like domain-containing protein [Aspergillus unguis]